MYDITGAISLVNILLFKLYSLSSSCSVLITYLDLVLALSSCLCTSSEGREGGIYTCWTLMQAWACDLEATRPSCDNGIIDSRNRFSENWRSRTLEDSNNGLVD